MSASRDTVPDAAPATEPRPGADRAPQRTGSRLLDAPRALLRGRGADLATDVLSFCGALLCAVLAAVAASMLGGCGGGVGSEGTGTGATVSFASGPITGFGSIVVGGIHFDETHATVHDDGDQAIDRGQLALGMVVQVTGGALGTDANGRTVATATQVKAVRALLGQVTARNLGAGTLTVLDQTVLVQADTVIDAGFGGALAGIGVGTVVEVYGSFDASAGINAWRATRIGPAPVAAASAYSLRGTVSAVDSAAKTAVVNGRTYSIAGLADSSAVTVGAVLRLDLQTAPDSQGRWVCLGDSSSSGAPSGDSDNAQASGLIGSINGTRWVVDGTLVEVSGASIKGMPQVGAQAQVSGVVRAGVLVAGSVSVSSADGGGRSFELVGTISALDPVRQRFVVRGTTVSYARADLAWKKGASAAALVGYTGVLTVKGVPSSDRSVLEATEIAFDN